jgi:hypothetical protein
MMLVEQVAIMNKIGMNVLPVVASKNVKCWISNSFKAANLRLDTIPEQMKR